MHLTMLELQQLEADTIFKNIVTIEELSQLASPPLHPGTIRNAINTGKLTVCKKGSVDNRGGMWLIHLPSAKKLWGERFSS